MYKTYEQNHNLIDQISINQSHYAKHKTDITNKLVINKAVLLYVIFLTRPAVNIAVNKIDI